MDFLNINDLDKLTDDCFTLDKVIWDKYDMKKTRDNVLIFLKEYNDAKSLCFKSLIYSNMSTNFDPNKVFVSSKTNNGGFSNQVDKKVDAENSIKNTEPLIKELMKTFTPKEKLYFEYCLLNNYSEEFIKTMFEISKFGLLPIKNSCILKFALVFDLAILKNNVSGLV